MPDWAIWVLAGFFAWVVLALALLRILGLTKASGAIRPPVGVGRRGEPAEPAPSNGSLAPRERRRILVVDDDPALRLLLRTTLRADDFALEEAATAEEAADLARFWAPDVVILDIGLPGMDGLTFCQRLKQHAAYRAPVVVLLTGAETTADEIASAGPDAVLRKPFSPLELVTLLDRLGAPAREPVLRPPVPEGEQLLSYAADLNRLLEVERGQRRLLQHAYRQTATALADALEAKDPVTGLHALRVQRYALELTEAVEPGLLDDASLEYGFLLHDVGKIGIPDAILQKHGPLTMPERALMQHHTIVGAQILGGVELLKGEGLRVVRCHHERWDGGGYPDGLVGRRIPLGARIFSLVDALDAMTSERPYRPRFSWDEAIDEILVQSGRQFDPRVVAAFAARARRMRKIGEELAETAA